MSLERFLRPAVTGLAVFLALAACESPNGAGAGGGDGVDPSKSDVAGTVVLTDSQGEPMVKIAEVDRTALQTTGMVKYYLENVSGQHLEDLSYYVMFVHPPKESEIQLDFDSEMTNEQGLVLNKADKRQEVVVESTRGANAAIQGTRLFVLNQAPHVSVPRMPDARGERYISGAIELTGMDGLWNSPQELTVELENISERNVGALEIQAVFLRGKDNVRAAQTTWQELPDIPPGQSVSKTLELPKVEGKLPFNCQIKVRPGSVF